MNPCSITSISAFTVEAPLVFQTSLLHRIIPLLHFFTSERLKDVVDYLQNLFKETLTLEAIPGKNGWRRCSGGLYGVTDRKLEESRASG
jgi:hypothetical protein